MGRSRGYSPLGRSETTQRRTLAITNTGWLGLGEIADRLGISKSQLVDLIGRRQSQLVQLLRADPPDK